MQAPGLIIAATHSSAGKTLVTLGIIRSLTRRGLRVGSFKVGPDYIDPAFHLAAGAVSCANLDSWAMRLATVASLAEGAAAGVDVVIGEGVMGLFDGAVDGTGSTADVAALLGLPVVLVLDVKGMGQSVAAMAEGFVKHRDDVDVLGLIFNRVGGERHAQLLAAAVDDHLATARLGALPLDQGLALPSRHLGLVQAREQAGLVALLERAADWIEAHLDLDRLLLLARPSALAGFGRLEPPLPPLGQRIAIADDVAFGFAYAAMREGWRAAGAGVHPFSPLADEPPDEAADAVFLPGGYPELYAGRLAGAGRFLGGLGRVAERGAVIYGECGGFMVLGRTLIDRDGTPHAMAGLLPIATSFAAPRLHLGYRRFRTRRLGPLGAAGTGYRGHEFHYARLVEGDDVPPLFDVADALDRPLGAAGAQLGRICGSFMHVIDRTPTHPRPATI
ncbi:MAG: cobyrinate a,c-diamide synthase [Geminicoccaceae bacterium]|nr:MAG: cobyrinate a,c-diamide synthase [Geminicoccaceae bacterium]